MSFATYGVFSFMTLTPSTIATGPHQRKTFDRQADLHGWRRPLSTSSEIENMHRYTDRFNVCSTAGWKVHHRAKGELAEIVKNRSHKVVQLNAFTFDGDRIAPNEYMSKIPRRLVVAKFTITHEVNQESKLDIFRAHVSSVHVLAPLQLMAGSVVNGEQDL
ncbi:hypothetical protein K435DRAFT_839470 [Dendrothele bispora CBS 962.96]|uniref:Uncharacterized protein n=1 Tax=Dendrothele bispora (strain CBS 962.96) TaxID=1314807 RepID=A0A4S8M079_DENBC|nr:hypothetical protein K435DRAFT_839470 [Dendrothele bispora CBS 962.96]